MHCRETMEPVVGRPHSPILSSSAPLPFVGFKPIPQRSHGGPVNTTMCNVGPTYVLIGETAQHGLPNQHPVVISGGEIWAGVPW